MSSVWIAAALRTAVGTRDGVFKHLLAWQLASPLINALLADCGLDKNEIQHVVMGNALGGGGNPARLAALDAGLPEHVPALTIDTQCCSGMDAIGLGAQMIRSGSADVVICGGLESWSRAPQRIARPLDADPVAYNRPPFSPWPQRDPDMPEAAAALAQARNITREEQEQFAIASHAKSQSVKSNPAIHPVSGVDRDEYARNLQERLCRRLPAISGEAQHELTAATIAAEADAAALVVLCSDAVLGRLQPRCKPVQLLGSRSVGGAPEQPALTPIAAAQNILSEHQTPTQNLYSVHLMEAFAVQAMACIEELKLQAHAVNPTGGALARGHPIGASGAIETVEAFHALQQAPAGVRSLCAIAAAGGLGTAQLLEAS